MRLHGGRRVVNRLARNKAYRTANDNLKSERPGRVAAEDGIALGL